LWWRAKPELERLDKRQRAAMSGAPESSATSSRRLSVLGAALLSYYVLSLTSSPLNQFFLGDYGTIVSVSYVPLVVLLGVYGLRLLLKGLDSSLALPLGSVMAVFGICLAHSTGSFDPFLIKCPLFFVFALLVAVNATAADIRMITRATYVCAVVYLGVGIPLWYLNVVLGVLVPTSFSEAMFFQKQDYTVVLTLVAGMFLYELLLSEESDTRRRYLMVFQIVAVVIGTLFFYIKSLFVVIVFSIMALWVLGVRRARKYVLGMGVGFAALYLTYEQLMLLDWLPDQVVAYIAWLFDDRFVSTEGARSLDTLTMRLAILEDNLEAMRGRLSNLLFGIGTNTAAHASFVSYLSGRERDLPLEMESGILQVFVYTGFVGLCVFLFSYLYGFKVWATARRNRADPAMAVFSLVVAVNLALLASNIFQDNLASVTWYWLGLLWYCVVRYRRAERHLALRQQGKCLESISESHQPRAY
jgi:hypothetical protein